MKLNLAEARKQRSVAFLAAGQVSGLGWEQFCVSRDSKVARMVGMKGESKSVGDEVTCPAPHLPGPCSLWPQEDGIFYSSCW